MPSSLGVRGQACPSQSRQGHAELALCSVALRRIQGEMRAGPLLPRVPFSPPFTSVWGRNGGHSSNCPFPLLRVFAATRAPQPRLRFLRKALARPASFTRRASRCERGRQIGVFRQNLFFFFPPRGCFEGMGSGLLPQPFSARRSSLLLRSSLTLWAVCLLCSKENFDSIPDLEFNPIRGKIVHAFFDKR